MAADLVRARVLVSGRVQGVFYRYSASQHARALGLEGWVANRDDGRVEAVIQGPPDAVQEMLDWCGMGPPAARVEGVEVTWEAPASDLGPFTTRG